LPFFDFWCKILSGNGSQAKTLGLICTLNRKEVTKMANPMKVLQESVIQNLEEGVKGAKVSAFHAYVDGPDDVEAEKIPQLKEDFLNIYKAFIFGMSLTEETIEVRVPTHNTGYSPLFGVPVDKDAQEVIASCLNETLDQCDLAIIAGCGFGKFSATPEKIREAQEQLRENVEKVFLPLPSGLMELSIIAYDSNNNLKHGRAADGLWEPFKAIGLIGLDDVILAFMATMDYGSGNWKVDQLGTELLRELAEKSSLFKEAYQKMTGKEFAEAEISEANPEFVEFIRTSPHFQQALNRVCKRWL